MRDFLKYTVLGMIAMIVGSMVLFMLACLGALLAMTWPAVIIIPFFYFMGKLVHPFIKEHANV